MAGYLDGQWRIGNKARGTRSPVKHASEGLLPFKSTYPVHLTDVMDQVPSAQSDLLRGAISPTRETRTLAVREYEEAITELRKENFDLKLQLYLKDKSCSKNLKRDVDDEVTIKIDLDLRIENDSLKKELRSKDQRLQEALAQSEINASQVKELQKTLVETQEQLKSISKIPLEWQQMKEDKEIFEKENEYFKSILTEKDTVIQNANMQIEDLSSQIEVLEAKIARRRIALQGIAQKYYTDIEKIPKELRPIVQIAVQAAKECKEEELNSALMELKSSIRKMMPKSSQEFAYGHQQNENETKNNSTTKLPNSSEASQGEVSLPPSQINSKPKFVHVSDKLSSTKVKLLSQSLESIDGSEKSFGSEQSENFEDMVTAIKDNEKLKAENDEKSRTIQDLNATCSELERRNIQLSSDLSEAVSKIKLLETKVQEENSKDDKLERIYLEDCLTQSNQVNHELMAHLRKLETFMEDLLQHRNLDSSSIYETSEVLSRLTSYLDDTRRLSNALSEQISIHENSKLFPPNDVSGRRAYNSHTEEESNPQDQSERILSDPNTNSIPQGRHPFSQLEPCTNSAGTGKRRLSFTTLHNASRIESENVVVLGTSNNEDLILLLNEKGDPEDVLIRNNQTEHQNLTEFYGQLPRHCLDSSLGLWNQSTWRGSSEIKYLNQEKSSERWFAPEIQNVRPNRCPSSDSDIWSEPDRNISMQRIGIDVQKSPVAQKSPRRMRLRTTNESSSLKNESSSSAVKCHPWSKRRRSGENLKSPFGCKKCLSPSKDDSAEKDRLQKVVNDLHNKCNNQENKLEEMNENLRNKMKEVEDLSKENLELLSYINELKIELKELKIKEKEKTLSSSESTGKLTEVNNENVKLKHFIKSLETKTTESDSIMEKLKCELKETKMSLDNLEEICSNYKTELSTRAKTLEDYKQKYDELEENCIFKSKEIDALSKENTELLKYIKELEIKVKELKVKEKELTFQSSEYSERLTEVNCENVKLNNFIKSLENKAFESDSICNKLKQELEETRKRVQNLDEKCSKYEIKLLTNEQFLENFKQKYDNVEKERIKFLNEIRELVSAKKELTQHIQYGKEKLQKILNENSKLKQELEKKSKSLIKLEIFKENYDNAEKEKDKSLNEISELVLAKNELIGHLQREKEKLEQILSENSNLKEELGKKSKSLTTLQAQYSKLETESSNILQEKEKQLLASNSTNFELKEQSKKSKSQIEDLQQDLKSTQDELEATKFYMEEMKTYVEYMKQSLEDTEKALEQSKAMVSSSETKLNLMQKQVERYENSLEEKNKQISELQNKVAKTGVKLTDALLENRLAKQSNTAEQPKEMVSDLYPSKGCPNVQSSFKTSTTKENTSARNSFSSSAKVEESGNKSVTVKYTEIKSLKTKLALSEQRIVILETEKGHLREHILAQVCKDKAASQSSEDLDDLRKDNADLLDQLQAKSSCIKDLKIELFQTCNSLLDKEKEVDDLRRKLSDSQELATETKSTSAQEGSQESIFQRSHFSSPDLGIESDPNHESSAPEQADGRSNEEMWLSVKQLPSVYIDRSTSSQVSDHATASGDTLHAICALRHYELLKKEVQESLNEIKSVLSRATDGLQHVANYTSPRKNLECSTFKAIIDTGGNIAVCLYKARELVEQFRIEPCLSIEEFNKLVQQNQVLQEELNRNFESRRNQERYFDEAMERLKQTEILKEQMDRKITKKLVKTKKVIRQAEKKLLEQGNQEMPPLPKYPTDEPTCQKKR